MKSKTYPLLAILIVLASAFTVIGDILMRLDLQASTAQRYILGNFTGEFENEISAGPQDETDHFQIPYLRKMLPAIMAGDKAGAAKELCAYIKMYCNSLEFENTYNKKRLSSLPLSDNGATTGVLMHNIEIHQINIKNYPNDKKYIAEEQKQIDEDQARLDKLLEKARGPFDLKKEWEAAYPADPAVVIRKRLQEYLTLVATVDFNAKLAAADKYKKQKFVNPVYEKKSLKWKAIYRAGKEVNDAVTVFVKDWLKGEIIAKQKTPMPSAAGSTKAPASATAGNTDDSEAATPDTTTESAGKSVAPVKVKKALLNKVKNKAKSVF